MRKKIVAGLLSMCLLMQGSMPAVLAAEPITDGAVAIEQKAVPKEDEIDTPTAEEKETEQKQPDQLRTVQVEKGSLGIEILFEQEVAKKNAQSMKAVLSRNGQAIIEQKFAETESGGTFPKWKAWITDIPQGTYTLSVAGEHFATYSQEVEISNQVHKVCLVNSGEFFELRKEAGQGIITYGDVDGNGTLEKKDAEVLTSAIHKGTAENQYDLNGDGSLDVLDIQILSAGISAKSLEAKVERKLDTTGISVGAESGTAVEGTPEDILKEEGQISLKPSDSGTISDSNPVEITIDLSTRSDSNAAGFTIVPPKNSENKITDGVISVVYEEEGLEKTDHLPIRQTVARMAMTRAAAGITTEPDGTIVVNLGKQIAIKKVIIKVTETESEKLADIAEVEFLNGMEDRIPEPQMNIPSGLKVKAGNKKFTLSWGAEANVTGYEVQITYAGKTETVRAKTNTLTVTSFSGGKLKNGEAYVCKVRSVNGEWTSPYSEEITASPKPEKAPDAPENVQVNGGYRQLSVNWKKMEDTDYYTLYYREKGTSDYRKVDKITSNSYTLIDLKDKCTYEVCLTGTNFIGTSGKSKVYVGTTITLDPAVTTNYKLINVPEKGSKKTVHVERVNYSAAAPESEFAVVDNDYTTSWRFNSWDAGGFNSGKPSPVITFDQEYEMDHVIVVPEELPYTYGYAKTRYWSGDGTEGSMIDGQFQKKTSSNGKVYYEFYFNKPIRAKKIQINFAFGYASPESGPVTISEMKFYYYDSLEDDIDALYVDGMHVTLKDTVTKETIDALETRLHTKDEVSGEYHPKKELLQKELDYARMLLNDQALMDQVQLDPTVNTSRDSHLKIALPLNTWQPLGVVAHEGEELTVYAGREGAAIGAGANISLIATQYHAESGTWSKTVVGDLKVGKNEVTIPKIASLSAESGGSLYAEYTKKDANAKISVRVSGGTNIPMLDVSKLTDETDRKAAVAAYVKELKETVPKLEENHKKYHEGNADSHCDYAYDKKNCIFGATEIVLKQASYSVSSEQILNALKNKGGETEEGQVQALLNSLKAMDNMVKLFYQHKGYADRNDETAKDYGTKNYLPSGRLNFRYMRMFAGAFMYAGGKHMGIEWGSIPGLASAVPVASANGKYQSGNYFGWGISHEAGHMLNQGSYAIAEITNNYYAVLSQAKDNNDSVRFKYPDVYEKVTSGTTGKSSSVFTSLAMYWQLHLAYDNGYNFKTYDTFKEQIDNLFFARVDMYDRDNSLAPAPKGIALTKGKNVDNTFMRLACAAAEKNLLSFFEAWGMVPDEDTAAYAEQFEKEERNIQYVCDDARVYRIEGGKNVAKDTKVQASLTYEKNTNQVKIALANDAADKNAMLGYEILRNGEPVGFVNADTTEYTDTIATINNRVFTYTIVGYDKLLNKTEQTVLDPVKISTDGSIAKDNWSVSTNMISDDDTPGALDDDNPEMVVTSAINRISNNDYSDVYAGNAVKPEIVVSFGEKLAVCGVKITQTPNDTKPVSCKIYVSSDGEKWELVKSDDFVYKDGEAVLYFNKENDSKLYTYDASYLKLEMTGQNEVSLSELDILGPSGDNVELLADGIGLLKDDYILDKSTGDKIPKGSLIFTGEYKGNPFYNAVKMYDQNDKLIGGSQVFFADEPKHGELGEISSGTWVFYIEPEELSAVNITSVRAELFRVDDAQTLKGERLVSDTMRVTVPTDLPPVELQGGSGN